MRYSPMAERRRRRIAARRPNRWLTEECPPADKEVLEYADWRMSVVDGMSPKWRALVHHYGFSHTNAMYEANMPIDAAWMALEDRKVARQEDWLRTDYVIDERRFLKRIVV